MSRLLALLLLISLSISAQPAANKPNILVIVADDLGYADIGVLGGKAVPTPNIDALAASGVRCTSGYVSSPYCSPSRAGFLTGRYQTRFGHEFNPHVGEEAKLGLPLDQRTIADHLRAAGYATSLIGKWHQGFDHAHHPQSRGFDDYFGFLVGGHNYLLHKDAKPVFGSAHSHDLIYRGREVQKLDGYTTDLFTDEALGFMDRHTEKPWFLYLAYNAVHTPLEIVDKHKDRIPADVTDPARRGYLSLLLGLDDAIGRITAHLEKTGRSKDTTIFFFSDNGGSGRKPYFAYNTGVNNPRAATRGRLSKEASEYLSSSLGPANYLLERYTTIRLSRSMFYPRPSNWPEPPSPANLDGVNLLPFLRDEIKDVPHDSLYWRFGPQKAVRRGQWKLVDWRDHDNKKNSGWQLFDLSSDVGEQTDQAGKQPELVAQLSRDWEQWNANNIAPLWHGSPTEDPTAPPRPATKKK